MQERDVGLYVGDIGKLRGALHSWDPTKVVVPAPTKCVVHARCGSVDLKVTLTAKFLAKPLTDVLLAPFLKAYCKRAGISRPYLAHISPISRSYLACISTATGVSACRLNAPSVTSDTLRTTSVLRVVC